MSVTAEQSLDVPLRNSTNAVDGTGSSFLIISYGQGENAGFAKAWLTEAAPIGPVQWLTFADFNADTKRQLSRALCSCRNGLRIMVVGPQFDVLQTIALARCSGALEKEVRSLVTDAADLPIYCAHCRETSRVRGGAGEVVTCPACARTVEIHAHLSGLRGSYLASDALARDLP
jgi:hypothetical protein